MASQTLVVDGHLTNEHQGWALPHASHVRVIYDTNSCLDTTDLYVLDNTCCLCINTTLMIPWCTSSPRDCLSVRCITARR